MGLSILEVYLELVRVYLECTWTVRVCLESTCIGFEYTWIGAYSDWVRVYLECTCIGFDFLSALALGPSIPLEGSLSVLGPGGAHQKHPRSQNKQDGSQITKIEVFRERCWQHPQTQTNA